MVSNNLQIVFSKRDFMKAYIQIPVEEADILKTAIITPMGLSEFTRMTFGFSNAVQTFQIFMHEVLTLSNFVMSILIIFLSLLQT